jgi:hypothetical protein
VNTQIRIIDTTWMGEGDDVRHRGFVFCLPPGHLSELENLKARLLAAAPEGTEQVVTDPAGLMVYYDGSNRSALAFCEQVVEILNRMLNANLFIGRSSFFLAPEYTDGDDQAFDRLMEIPGFALPYLLPGDSIPDDIQLYLAGLVTLAPQGDGWTAHFTSDTACWEAGKTRDEAIAKLIISRGNELVLLARET